MKKKLLSFLFIFLAVLTLVGCNYTPFTDISDILGSSSDSNSTSSNNTTIERPVSSESNYQSPVSLPENPTATKIVESYLDCTVTIFVADSTGTDVCFGSGICIYAGGYIATNYHVIADAITYSDFSTRIYLNENQITSYPANILWANETLDVAIIQSSNGNIPFVKMKDRVVDTTNPLKLLEQVVTIGTPEDFSLQNSCSIGYISGLNRYAISETNVYETLIQHTAPISSGCSGGPLFDMQGNLIGLNTLGLESGNEIYFSVPIAPIAQVIERVVTLNEKTERQTYSTPYMGIQLTDSQLYLAVGGTKVTDKGVYITKVVGGGAANSLKVGDIVVKFNFEGIERKIDCRNHLIYATLCCNKGDTITLTIIRNSVQTQVELVLT